MTGERTVGRRSVPGTDRTASVLGVSVELPPIAPPEADRQLVALLRKARGEGVTVFDVGGSNSPARAEHLVATAFPQHDPELLIIVRGALPTSHMPRPSATTMPVPADPRVLDGLRTRLTKSRARLAPQTPGILEWGVDEANPEELSLILPALESLRSAGEVTGWSLRLRPDREALGAHLAHDRPKLISTELSLLDPLLTAYLEAQAGTAEFGAFVRGPFAGGLLDGTRFTSALSDRSPRSAPIDVRALRTEFAPVLRLGFLSSGGRRTLAQAALQYLLPRRWVASVLVPLPRPERWEDVFGAAASPALSADELARVESVGPSE